MSIDLSTLQYIDATEITAWRQSFKEFKILFSRLMSIDHINFGTTAMEGMTKKNITHTCFFHLRCPGIFHFQLQAKTATVFHHWYPKETL